MIRRDELEEMQRGIDALVTHANRCAATDLANVEGFRGEQRRQGADDGTAAGTIRWRVGLSSAPPRTVRVGVRTGVDELLTEVLEEHPALRQRGPMRWADNELRPIASYMTLEECGLQVGGSLALVLVPDETRCSDSSTIRRSTEARAAAARDSSDTGDLLRGGLSSERPVTAARSAAGGFTILYRLGKRAPRSLQSGPQATVIDVLEEIAEREPTVAIRLSTGEQVQLLNENQAVLPLNATLQSLGFRPGGTHPVSVV